MYRPVWKDVPIGTLAPDAAGIERLVLLAIPGSELSNRLKSMMNGAQCLDLEVGWEDIAEAYTELVLGATEQIQTLVDAEPQKRVLLQLVIPSAGQASLFRGLSGLFKTMQLEHPNLQEQVIEVGEHVSSEALYAQLGENGHCPGDHHVRYRNGMRQVSDWE